MVGQTLSHYKILSEISRGGMGVVYRAVDTKLNREVALKVLPPELVSDPERRRRFIQEAQAAAALEHPHIAVVHEIDEKDAVTFIAMELIRGVKLQEHLQRVQPSPTRALELAIEVAEGLACAHEKGIVHRDLKPSNIMLTEDGHAKIIDFGLAKLVEPLGAGESEVETAARGETSTGAIMGTVSYMSPEQAKGQKVDHRTDIFSFGIVLYEMLTGEQPFKATSSPEILTAIIHSTPKPLAPTTAEDLTPDLQRILDRCLEKDPDSRYQKAKELVRKLRHVYRQLLAGPKTGFQGLLRTAKSPKFAAAIFVLLVLAGVAGLRILQRNAKIRWAREVAIPEISGLVEQDNYVAAVSLAEEAEPYLEGDEDLAEIWTRMSQHISVTTSPAGANVFLKPYSETEAEEEYLGQSPIEVARIPLGPYWLRIENEGYETIESFFPGLGSYDSPEEVRRLEFQLDETGNIPPGMVRIPDSTVFVLLIGLPEDRVPLPTYLIDKHEVSNREFKRFVDSGGYQNPEYWDHEFNKEGRVLSFEEAMAELRDRTGQPGPSMWEVGTYPEGRDDYPVSGVSWYEAAAYAKFAGKTLPTIYHWVGATNTRLATFVVPFSNFSNQGPRPVGSGPVGPQGTYDMAGNVKEWCWNASETLRFILSGGWNEPSYMYYEVDAQSPFNRLSTYGFRCAKYLESDEQTLQELRRSIRLPAREIRIENPVSDDVFDAYKSQYAYDPTDLESTVESVDESHPHWMRERITFNAAYGNERGIAYLFVPRNVAPPFQTVVYFPGASARRQRSIDEMQLRIIDFVIKSGRAVMYPIYKATHERYEETELPGWNTRAAVDYVICWVNDLRRSVDYLETRDDIDMTKLAYYGFSWGGIMGPVNLALEKRLRLGILLDGGLDACDRPEICEWNFAPRATVPVLMVNGTNDITFPVETSQKPLFKLLGTPEAHKRHVLFECGHSTLSFWRNQGIKEILTWLDHYFGRPEMVGQ